MTNKNSTSRAWIFGDDIDTDQLAPGRFMKDSITELASHCLEDVKQNFSANVEEGDVLPVVNQRL